jgi:hypothetical protein
MKRFYAIVIAADSAVTGKNATRDTTVIALDAVDAAFQVANQVETNRILAHEEPDADTLIIAVVPNEIADALIRKLTN